MKEMCSNIAAQPKNLLNPFIIAKLDVETIRNFDFAPSTKDSNKYTERAYGIPGGASII